MYLLKKDVFYINLSFLIIFILGCSFRIKNSGQKDNSILYSIVFEDSNSKVVKVKAVFFPEDSLLFMGNGANNLEKRWATFIHNIKVEDEYGGLIELDELPDAKWKIHGDLNRKVVLTYEVHLDHENFKWSGGIDGVAYSTDKGVFYTGRTLFIMNGELRENILIDFELPSKWHLTTPWIKASESNNSYKVNDFNDLSNAMIFAGTHKELSIKRDDFELLFALGSTETISEESDFSELAEGVFDYYTELMGGLPKFRQDDLSKKVVVVISSGSATDGEVIGKNISILIEKDADAFSKALSRFIFAHEFFHLWNGKSFSPTTENTEWFKEGFTNYYTLKALHQINFLTDESYLNFLGNFFYQRYSNDNGVGKFSMTNGEKKHDHWGLIYAGGMLVGIVQDLIIRNATNNEKNIDELMRGLFFKYGGKEETYTLGELQNLISELSGVNPTDFFNSYVIGVNKIPVEDFLLLAGLDAKIQNGNLILWKKQNQTPLQYEIMKGLFGQIRAEN